MARAREGWLELLLEEVGHLPTARAILLIGDGLYFDAALTGGADCADAEHLGTDELMPVIGRLLDSAPR